MSKSEFIIETTEQQTVAVAYAIKANSESEALKILKQNKGFIIDSEGVAVHSRKIDSIEERPIK